MNNVVELRPEQVMDENQRMQECYNIISAVLSQYGCELQCSATIDHLGKIDYNIKVQVKKGE